MSAVIRFIFFCLSISVLSGCLDSPNSGAKFTLNENSVSFIANKGGDTPASTSVTGRVSGATDDVYIYVVLDSTDVVRRAEISVDGEVGTLTLFPAYVETLTVDTHTDKVSVLVCNDENCISQISGSPATINVTYVVSPDPSLVDSDNDSVPDAIDAFPNDPNETSDLDGDKIGDNSDTDIDGDGVLNEQDAFPRDATEFRDSDGDGIGDNSDFDRDNDGVNDDDDAFPDNITEWIDTDGDNIGNNTDTDDDGDSYLDANDAFPLDSTEWLDTDGDLIGNNADSNDDGDAYPDNNDAFPLDNTEWLDTDGDSIGNNADTDDDGDTYLDGEDAFPLDNTEWLDTDGDLIGNNADTDDDGDSYLDVNDAFPLDSTEWLDTDGDLIGNNADTDDDGDTYLDGEDAFPLDNTEWLDTDGDLIGNNADDNDDNDYFLDVDDIFPLDDTAPAKLLTSTPATLVESEAGSVIVSGIQLSELDTFYIGEQVLPIMERYEGAIKLSVPALSAGTYEIKVQYTGYDYESVAGISVLARGYHNYAELIEGGRKSKAYFSDVDQTLYLYNSGLSQISKYQLVTGSGWVNSKLPVTDINSIAMNQNGDALYAIKDASIVKIDTQNLVELATQNLAVHFNSYYSDAEFDALGGLVLVSDYSGSGSTYVKRLGMEAERADYQQLTLIRSLYNSAISVSGDGSFILLGQSGLSPMQSLVQYKPLQNSHNPVTPTHSYNKGDISRNGDYILVNNQSLYNKTFSLLATLQADNAISAAAISDDGSIALTADSTQLYYYELADAVGNDLPALHSVAIDSSVGNVNEIILSKDKLTAFVIGSNKILVVPIWQIVENDLASEQSCPASGCADIALQPGVVIASNVIEAVPVDNEQSTITSLSPNYVHTSWDMEILVSGSNFAVGDVVQFGNSVATAIRVESANTIWAKVPTLSAGEYTVTVNGHALNAPSFKVVGDSAASDHFWLIGGIPAEMKFNAVQDALYLLDSSGDWLHKIDLSDSSVLSLELAGASDFAICPQNDALFVANGTDVISVDMADLTSLGSVVTTEVTTLECGANRQLMIAYNGQWKYIKRWDITNQNLTSVGSSFYKASITGASVRGDQMLFSENGITSPDRFFYRTYNNSSAVINNAGAIKASSWSADGSLGIITDFNSNRIVNQQLGEITDLSFLAGILATTISLDGSVAYAVSSDTIYKISLANDLNNLSVQASYTIVNNIGTPKTLVTNSDGSRVFVAGTNGVQSIAF